MAIQNPLTEQHYVIQTVSGRVFWHRNDKIPFPAETTYRAPLQKLSIHCTLFHRICGSSSVGRASASQAECREFEPRPPLRGRSSVVEHHVANVRVVGSNPIARYNINNNRQWARSFGLFTLRVLPFCARFYVDD